MFKKKLGLVLGGGGAKGYAHIGVLKFLEENNIEVNYVVGTSIGAIVGALYCLGYSADEIEKIARETKFRQLFDLTIPKKGLIKGDKIERYLRHIFENKNFSDLEKKFFAVAVDINEFREVIFDKGDLTKAVRASISIPGIFHPVENKKRVLVDGGILNNLPIDILKKKGVENILAVNLEKETIKKEVYEKAVLNKSESSVGITNVLLNSYIMILASQLRGNLYQSKDTLIISPNLEKIKMQDFKKIDEGIKEGYNCAKKNSGKIKKLMGKGFFNRKFY